MRLTKELRLADQATAKLELAAGLKDLDCELNSVVFGNAWHHFNLHFSIGLEISGLRTDYPGGSHGDCLREQLSLPYRF